MTHEELEAAVTALTARVASLEALHRMDAQDRIESCDPVTSFVTEMQERLRAQKEGRPFDLERETAKRTLGRPVRILAAAIEPARRVEAFGSTTPAEFLQGLAERPNILEEERRMVPSLLEWASLAAQHTITWEDLGLGGPSPTTNG